MGAAHTNASTSEAASFYTLPVRPGCTMEPHYDQPPNERKEGVTDAFDRFMDTRDAVITLGHFIIFAVLAFALLVAMGQMIYRTGVQGTDPPLSVYTTLKHPTNAWLVENMVQPALAGQSILLVSLANTRAHGFFTETVLAAATVAAYIYVAVRAYPASSIAWLGHLTVSLYAVAWMALIRDMGPMRKSSRTTVWCVVLQTLCYMYIFMLYVLAPSPKYTTSPTILYMVLSVVQPVFIVPMIHAIHTTLDVQEVVYA